MSEGIIIGYNQIPIEPKILDMMKEYGFDSEYTQQCLDANKHNHATTTYYLFLKRLKKEGKLRCEYEISNSKLKESIISNRNEMSVRSRIEYENSLEKLNKIKNKDNQNDKELSSSKNKKVIEQKIDTDFGINNLVNQSNCANNKPLLKEGPENKPNSLSNSKKIFAKSRNIQNCVYSNSVTENKSACNNDNSNLVDLSVNQTQLSNRDKEKVNLSLLFDSKDLQDISAHELICNELLNYKKRGNAKSTDKSRQGARSKLSEDYPRSVISSDNDGQESSNRKMVSNTNQNPTMFQSYSSKKQKE